MKYQCPKCQTVFEGGQSACPNCGQKMTYLKEEKVEPIKEKKKRNTLLGLAIAAIVIATIGCIVYPFLVLNLTGSVNHLFDITIPKIAQTLWKFMVKEFFTFIFFVAILIIAVFGVLIGALAVVALGPIASFIALIMALVACIHKSRKWYSFMALGFVILSIIADIITLSIFFAK